MNDQVSLTTEDAPAITINDFAGLSQDIFWELDDTLQFTWISERIEQLTGTGPHATIGKPPWEVFDANPLEDVWCRLRADFDNCRPFQNSSYKFVDRDGCSRHCAISGNPFFDSSGSFKGFRGIIAEKPSVSEAVFTTEARYREIFNLAPVSLFEEDWSGVKSLIDRLVDQGVGDLRTHFKTYPDCLVEASSKIKIVDVNLATLESFSATDKSSFLTALHGRLSREPFDNFGCRLAAHAEGRTTMISEAKEHHADGSDLHLRITTRIPHANRNDWSRVLSAVEDITERKRAETALQVSEQGLANAQRLAHLGHWDWDIDSGNLYMSDEAIRIYGFEPQAFTATLDTCLQAIHLDDRDRVIESVDKSISLGRPFNNEFRILRPDGTLRHVHERGEVTFGDDGAPMRLSGTVHDITERKRMEQALHASGLRYQHLFDNAPIAILEEDWSGIKRLIDRLRDDGVEDLNRYFEETPDALEELPGQIKCLDFNQATAELYRAESKDALWYEIDTLSATMSWQNFGAVIAKLADGRPFVFHESIDRTMDGADIWVNERIYIPEHARDDWSRVVLTIEDVTERNKSERALAESEQQYRAIVEDQTELICRYLPDGTFTYANGAYCRYFDKSADELIGNKFAPLIPDGDLEMVVERLQSLDVDNPVISHEHRVVAPSGEVHWQQWTDRALFDDTGSVIEFQSVGRDIHDRKLAEQALRESEARFKQAAQLANLGHWSWDEVADRTEYISEEIARIHGMSIDEYLSTVTSTDNDIKRVHPDDRKRYASVITSAQQHRTAYDVTYKLVRRDGTIRHVREMGEPMLDESGALIRSVGTIQDITEQKLTEEALRTHGDSLRLLHSIAVAANETEVVEEAMQTCLDAVCAYTGWPVGHVYRLADDGSGELASSGLWHLDQPDAFTEFVRVTETTRFAPGVGLPGRVLADLRPAWIVDVTKDPNFPRATMAENLGVRAGLAFPVLIGRDIVAVLEFFSDEAVQPDAHILVVMAQVGTLLGRVIERQRANMALRESEAHLKRAQAITRIGYFLWDEVKDEVITRSDVIYDIYGVSSEAAPKTFDQLVTLVHPDDRDRLRETVAETQAARKAFDEEYRIVRPDGEIRWIHEMSEPEYDAHGRLVRGMGTCQDITERKQAEEALRVAEAQYRQIFEQSPLSIWEEDWSGVKLIVDRLGKLGVEDLRRHLIDNKDVLNEAIDTIEVLQVNQATLDIYGATSKQEIIADTRSDRMRDTERETFLDQIINYADGAFAFADEVIEFAVDGREINTRLRGVIPPGHRENWSRVITTVEDITERKQAEAARHESEERFRTLVEHAPEAITMLDVDTGFYLDANPMAEVLHGLPRDELIGNFGPADLSPDIQPDGRPSSEAASEYLSRALAGEFPKFEWLHLAANGRETLCEVSLARLPDPHRNLVRASISDITERKQAEAALHESEARYRQLFESSPIGLWEEDWSSIKVMVDELKKQGVKDWRRYFSRREDQLARAYDMGRQTNINQAALDIYRAPSKQAVLGMTGSDQVLPEELPEFLDSLIAFIEGRTNYVFESKERTYDGFEIVTRRHAIIPPDDQNTWSRVLYSIEDITERRLTEATVRELNARFMAFLDNVPEAMSLKDLDGRYILVNVEFEKMLGLSSEEIYGKTDPEVMPWDAEIRSNIVAHERAVLESKSAIAQERESFLSDGTFQSWVITKFPVFDENGDVVAIGTTNINITEHKQAEAALRESEARFRAVVNNSPTKIHIKGIDGRYTLVNRVAEKLFNVTDEEARGKTSQEIFSRDIAAAFAEHDQVVLKTGRVVEQEEEWPSEDGIRTYLTVKFPILDAGGRINAIGAIGTDITERKNLEEEVLRREQVLSEAQWIGHIGHWRLDMRKREFTDWSDEVYRIVGVDRKTFTPTLDNYQAMVHEDDLQMLIDTRNMALVEMRPYKTECRVVRPNGEVRTIANEARPEFNENGEMTTIFGVTQDITERKNLEEEVLRREQELSEAQRIGHIGHWRLDMRKREFTDWSNETYRIFGIDRETFTPTLDNFIAMIHKDDLQMSTDNRNAALAEKRPYKFEYRIVRPNGEVRTIAGEAQPEFDECGEVTTIFGVTQDITERERIEEQLRQAQKLEAVGQLTGGIAHDFNNQLAVILGNLQLFEEEVPANFESLELLHRAIEATNKSAELTHRLLAFSRKQTLQPRLIDVNGLATGMIAMLQRSLGETIAIETMYCPELWQALVDPGQLENVLLNLAINARDAMPKGGRLTIKTANWRRGDESSILIDDFAAREGVVIAVSDTGTGMTPDIQKRIFEPFFTTKEVGRGSGLGLSMVFGFVTQSGGHVQIDSAVGRGTTITILLPRATSGRCMAESTSTEYEPHGNGETILIVEDDANLREVNAHVLDRLGYRPLQAEDALSALTILNESPEVAILFTDVVLPGGMSGVDLMDEAIQQRPDLKVLFTSGYADDAIIDRGRIGVDVELIEKPFSKEFLARKIHSFLERGLSA